MKSSFKDLQTIYEAYRGDISDWSGKTSGMRDLNTAPMSQSYPKGGLPGAQPGQGTSMLTTTISDDEEETSELIPKQLVINKISELLDETTMAYAHGSLVDILNFVKKLKGVN